MAFRAVLFLLCASAAVAAGCSDDNSGPGCGDGFRDETEECDGTDLSGQTCLDHGFDGGDLACTNGCTFDTSGCCESTCATENASRCADTVIETCTSVNGCLAWTAGVNCADTELVCDDASGSAECRAGCINGCQNEDDLRCRDNKIEICTAVGQCLDWRVQEDCAETDTICFGAGSVTRCAVNGSGESCAEPIIVTAFPTGLAGADFTSDFSDDLDLSSNTDCTSAEGEEVIFAVYLEENQSLRMTESGAMDAVIRVLDTCDGTSACLLSVNSPEDAVFTAPASGVYYVVLESYYSDPGINYDFKLDILPSEGGCCSDEWDNDDDGLTDCADPDCAAWPACATCADATPITSFPFVESGADITVDFTDAIDFGQLTGCGQALGVEAVYLVNMQEGETIRVYSTDHVGGRLRVLDGCGLPTAQCLEDVDRLNNTNAFIRFTAPSTADYFVVFEAASATPGFVAYSLHVDSIPTMETDCSNGADDDWDGLADCLDPDCAGSCVELLNEGFDTWPPTGWNIQDYLSDGLTWEQCDGCSWVLTSSVGPFAGVESDIYADMMEGLITPSFDCSPYSSVLLSFTHSFDFFCDASESRVEVSTNGGGNWNTVAAYSQPTPNGQNVLLDLSARAAGHPNVMVRFFFFSGNDECVWSIDSVRLFGLY